MSQEKKNSIARRVAVAGGWRLAKRLSKSIPFVGTAMAIGLAGHSVRRKGFAKGALDVSLDLIPIVGTAKTVLEIFTGDLIPDNPKSEKKYDKK